MRFSTAMLLKWESYKATLSEFEMGLISVEMFLIAHHNWNNAVEAFERECSSAANYGSF